MVSRPLWRVPPVYPRPCSTCIKPPSAVTAGSVRSWAVAAPTAFAMRRSGVRFPARLLTGGNPVAGATANKGAAAMRKFIIGGLVVVVLTVGAGDVTELAALVLDALRPTGER